MKSLTIILLCLCATTSVLSANRPDYIPSRLEEVKARNWYQEKYISWMQYLGTNQQDRPGWMECFKAALYGGLPVNELQSVSKTISELFPESGEAYWAFAKTQGYTENGVVLMEKALAELKTKDVLADRVILSELLGTDRASQSKALFDTQMMYPSLLNYAYNVLMSVGENGVLITEGESTTVPLWVLQDELGVRRDVKILNLELFENQSYKKNFLSQNGINMDGGFSQLAENNPHLSFYYALTLPRHNFELINDKLYVVGLASLLSEKEINNFEILRANIEDRFLLDYLTVDFNGEPKSATGKSFETNYIVPFYLLKQYYDQQGNENRSRFLADQIKAIADRSQLGGRVNMLMSQKTGPKNFKIVELDVKTLDKKYKKVKDNIYASNVELTNREYQFFQDYLKQNGYEELEDIAEYDFSRYDAVNKAFASTYHYNDDKTKVMNYSDYPTMDITYEAAKLYCEWLTAQYNAQEKRTYKKVKFRLPSRQEWIMAALGEPNFQSWNFEDNTVMAKPKYDEKTDAYQSYKIKETDSLSYPWYKLDWTMRNSVINNKGCYLANVYTPEGTFSCANGIDGDGFKLPAPVASYFANHMGLYDVVGNVAEMINEPGKAMGGSWNLPAARSTITSMSTYDIRSNEVGFRIFMEVLED